MKKIKYWQRNGGFKVWPEVKITRLIDILGTVFSNQFFHFSEADTKKLKLIGNLSDSPQILTIGRLTHKQQTVVREFFLSKYFFNMSDFCTKTPCFLNPFSKMFCNFSLKMNMANRTHVVFALWARKLRDTLNKLKIKFVLTCKVQKVIRALAVRSREKFDNSFLFKIFGIV